jgi:hypothetical protein
VYRVNQMPESMIPYIWDYKSLNEKEEHKYINKMVTKTYENSTIQGRSFSLIKLWIIRDPAEQKKVAGFKAEINSISTIV